MARVQISVDPEIVQGLFQRDDGLARLVESVLNQILEAQVTERLGAEPYERTAERQGYRNGSRERTMKTRVGALSLEVPEVREGVFSTELFARYQRNEQALVLAMMEMVVNGVSTRKVKRITEELCGTSFSRSTVSELCRGLDQVVEAWNGRDLGEQAHPFVIVDALVLRIREDGHVSQRSAFVAVGVGEKGQREILGLMLGDSESQDSWSSFFAWLKERGLKGVDLVVSDDHAGLVAAVRKHFQGVLWQRCQTHLSRNVLDVCPKALQAELHSRLRPIFEAPDAEVARVRLEAGFDDAVAVLALPQPYRRLLRTTNGLERLNEEIRRRERVIRIFPNEVSALRLLGALLMEQDDIWTTGRKYFDMTCYWEWRAATETTQPAERGNAA